MHSTFQGTWQALCYTDDKLLVIDWLIPTIGEMAYKGEVDFVTCCGRVSQNVQVL